MSQGGRGAAAGFHYQYLKTLESLIGILEADDRTVEEVQIEGPPASSPDDGIDTEIIDYQLVKKSGDVAVVAQVKSGHGVLTASTALATFLRMVSTGEADAYELVTNLSPHPQLGYLTRLLATTNPGVMRSRLLDVMARSPARAAELLQIPEAHIGRLRRCRLVQDPRSAIELRVSLRERIRRYRQQSQRSLGQYSAGLMTGYLVGEVLYRAAHETEATLTIDQFRSEVLMRNDHLAQSVGWRDWGVTVGLHPHVPDIARPSYEKAIAEQLTSPRQGHSVVTVVLAGPSGIGKTSLAARYAGERADGYDLILWVQADSADSLVTSFRLLGDELGIEGVTSHAGAGSDSQLRDRVHVQLAKLTGPWLMIMDGVVSRRTVQDWIPVAGAGEVIITSTDSTLWGPQYPHIDVQPMEVAEALALLESRFAAEAETSQVRDLLELLACELAYWPLALEMAAGYMQSCGLSVAEVPTYLTDLKLRSLKDDLAVPPGYPRTLVAALMLCIGRILRTGSDGSEVTPTGAAAYRLLVAMSYFGSRQIPLHLCLNAGIVPIDALLSSGLEGPTVMVSGSGPFEAAEVIRALRIHSLVRSDLPLVGDASSTNSDVDPEFDKTLSCNVLIQDLVRSHAVFKAEAPEILLRAVFHAYTWLEFFLEQRMLSRALTLIPHAMRLADHAESMGLQADYLALLLGNVATVQLTCGDTAGAQRLFERELRYLEARLPRSPILEAKVHAGLANAFAHRGLGLEGSVSHLLQCIAIGEELDTSTDALGAAMAIAASTVSVLDVQGVPADTIQALGRRLDTLLSRFASDNLAEATRLYLAAEAALEAGDSPTAQSLSEAVLAIPAIESGIHVDARRQLIESLSRQAEWQRVCGELKKYDDDAKPPIFYWSATLVLVFNVGLLLAAGAQLLQGDAWSLEALQRTIDLAEGVPGLADDRRIDSQLQLLRSVRAAQTGDPVGAEKAFDAARRRIMTFAREEEAPPWLALEVALRDFL